MATEWANPNVPNLPDFLLFVQFGMAIDPLYLPTDSPVYQWSLTRALALVINLPACAGPDYTLAVYNCAGHVLITIAPDQEGRDYFECLREKLGLLKFAAGVVAATADQATSTTLAVPDSLAQLTIGDLDFIRSPWGRVALAYNQDYGGIWGLS